MSFAGATLKSEGSETDFTPHAEHLANAPITKISPTKGPFPDTTGAEEEFKRLCQRIKRPVQMQMKREIEWNKRDPLHFWQSLSFILKSQKHPCVAVSSFLDSQGQTKLYIASNDPMTLSEQQEITEIIQMFLDLKPMEEITAKILPRHLPLLIDQFKKCIRFVVDFTKDFPGELASSARTLALKLIAGTSLSLDEIRSLMDLIVDDKSNLRAIKGKGDNTKTIPRASQTMAYHLCKMVRILEEIQFVYKKIRRHQQDRSLKSLSSSFEFISLNCHAGLAILKTAKDCCESKTLYIGVSKRPCYCCSLFFKAVEENQSTKFNISIVTTHGKLYGGWNKIENCFEKEFNQVWAKVIQDLGARLPRQTDNNSSESRT